MPLKKLWKDTFCHWVRIFALYNLPVFLLLLPVLILSFPPLTSGALEAVKVPEFIVEFIRQNPKLFICFRRPWLEHTVEWEGKNAGESGGEASRALKITHRTFLLWARDPNERDG